MLRLFQSSLPVHAADVQEARTDKFIGGQRAVIGVEAVRGDEDVRIAARTVRRHDDRRMLPADAVERELHDIARPDALRRDFPCKRAGGRRAEPLTATA